VNEPRRILFLVPEGLSAARGEELRRLAGSGAEILILTESNSREALEKIFAADTVAVWADLAPESA
jgi:hypothetical protein